MFRPQLVRPDRRFVSFFGCDGVGKSAITNRIAETMGARAVLMRGTRPSTWPGGPTEDYFAREQEIRQLPDGLQKAIATAAFTNTLVVANYVRAAELAETATVLNDSDVLLKTLVQIALTRPSINQDFARLARLLASDADGFFPANIVHVRAQGDVTSQTAQIAGRLNGRQERSIADPTTVAEIRDRVDACERVADYLSIVGGDHGFAVHRIENPPLAAEHQQAGIYAIAQNVIQTVGLETAASVS